MSSDIINNFKICGKTIGLDTGSFIIGEIAQAHDGSLGMAHAYIDVIADAGADAVKFQTHIADQESTLNEPWRVKFSTQDNTRFDYWKRMEFSREQWIELKQHAESRGLIFLSSPFSVKAVHMLAEFGMPAWKIASGEITDMPLLEAIAGTGSPVLLSTGMSNLEEIDRTVAYFDKQNIKYGVMQCCSSYPCPPESVGLNMIHQFRERYHCPVGLSDHSGTIYPALAAVTLGANIIEIHVAMSRQVFGPDVPASVTPAELQQLISGVRFINKMNANPVDKDTEAAKVEQLRFIFFKGLVAKHNLSKGTKLTADDIAAKKPATGIPAEKHKDIIGKVLQRSLNKDEPINWSDLE